MKPTLGRPLTDDELHALADGQVTTDARTELQSRLSDDTDGQTRLSQWQDQRATLRDLYADVLHETVPPGLLQAIEKSVATRNAGNLWRSYGGVAAALFIAFGAGWFVNGSWQDTVALQTLAPKMARAQLERDFVQQAGMAHSIYTPEVRHPVEVTALEQAHLVQWLSKRLGKPLKVPDLTAQGFELVGGRLLPGDTGARAQFMFQNATGSRVTLYLGAIDMETTPGLSKKETSFRYEPKATVPSFYWLDQGFGYALAGQLPREALMKLADLVYQQL